MVCMLDTSLQNPVRPRIGVFCDRQYIASDLLTVHVHPLWISSSLSKTNQHLRKLSVDIVLCWFDQPRPEYLQWVQSVSADSGLLVIVVGGKDADCAGEVWLQAGAERYLTQPLTHAYLLANISRAYQHLQNLQRARLNVTHDIQHEIWRLNCLEWQLFAPSGLSMALTKLELRFLQILMSARGDILPRLQLARGIYVNRSDDEFQRMEMLISRLRKKARLQLHQDLPVKTSYADGLVFVGEVLITPSTVANW